MVGSRLFAHTEVERGIGGNSVELLFPRRWMKNERRCVRPVINN